MKSRIIDIAERLYHGFISEAEAEEELLILFDIRISDTMPTTEQIKRYARLSFLPHKPSDQDIIDVFVEGTKFGISFNHSKTEK